MLNDSTYKDMDFESNINLSMDRHKNVNKILISKPNKFATQKNAKGGNKTHGSTNKSKNRRGPKTGSKNRGSHKTLKW